MGNRTISNEIFVTHRVTHKHFLFLACHRPSVRQSSVTFVYPTQAIEIFGNISTEIVPEEPLRLGVKAKRDSQI